jgi:hypothetical protein
MAIDMASVYAARYRKQPDMLRAAVMGQSPDPKLDSYTALNALRLVKEADMMEMAGQAQQPTSAPSLVAQNMAPPAPPQGLGAMVPGAMGGQGMPPQGMPPQQRAPMPQQPMQAASGGLAGMYSPEEDYAAGGIVAFQAGGETEEDYQRETSDTGYSDSQGRRTDAEGNLLEDADTGGSASRPVQRRAFARQDEYLGFDPEEMTPAQQEAFLDRYEARMKRAAGPDIYAPAKERQKAREDAIAGDRRSGEGLAYLTAAGAVLKGRSLAEGASNALPAYAQQLAEVRRAEREEKRSIEQMNFSLADAERKERMGNQRGAQAALGEARKFQQDANKAKGEKLRYSADIATRNVQYDRLANKGAGAGPKYQEQILQNNVDYFKSTLKPKPNETPEAFDARVRKTASDETARALKTSFSTGEIGAVNAETRLAPTRQRIDADVVAKLGEFKDGDRAYRAAVRKKNTNEANRLLVAEEARLRAAYQTPEAAPAKASATPAAAPKPTTTSKAVSMADVRATVASSGRTEQEVIDALKANGYTIK